MDWQQIEKKGPWDEKLVLRPSTRINSKRYDDEVEADYMLLFSHTLPGMPIPIPIPSP